MAAIEIGASTKAVEAAHRAINDILGCPHAEQKTKRLALTALLTICGVDHATITGCHFHTKAEGEEE